MPGSSTLVDPTPDDAIPDNPAHDNPIHDDNIIPEIITTSIANEFKEAAIRLDDVDIAKGKPSVKSFDCTQYSYVQDDLAESELELLHISSEIFEDETQPQSSSGDLAKDPSQAYSDTQEPDDAMTSSTSTTVISTQPSSPAKPTLKQGSNELVLEQPSARGLFSLPREVRDRVYFYALRPDCRLEYINACLDNHDHITTGRDRSKLLYSCSRVYFEAIELLHCHENIITITSKRGPIFRDMRDFGRPSIFTCDKRVYGCHIPPRFCELQVFRFRSLAICVKLPAPPFQPLPYHAYSDEARYKGELSGTADQICSLIAVIEKSPHIRRIRLMISCERRQDPIFFIKGFRGPRWTTGWRHHVVLKNLLRPLIDLAISRGILVAAEEDRMIKTRYNEGSMEEPKHVKRMEFSPEIGDPLVSWVKAIVPPALRQTYAYTYRLNTTKEYPSLYEDGFPEREHLEYRDWQWARRSLDFEDQEQQRFMAKFDNHPNASTKYQLVPECRSCYAIFSTWEDLKIHLVTKPDHKTAYREKAGNKILDSASSGGTKKCYTCAWEPACTETMTKHYKRFPHHEKNYIIPRWKEDNWRYARKAKMIPMRRENARLKKLAISRLGPFKEPLPLSAV